MTYAIGLDIGSLSTKILLLERKNGSKPEIVDYVVRRSTYDFKRVAREILEELLANNQLQRADVSTIMGTGYGRHSVEFISKRVTEISAHGRGVAYFFPDAKTVIDIGGQDSKVIKLNGGKVMDFQMNDKCAAGTGRFCEVMARALEVPLERLGPLSLESKSPEQISSTCTVFAESEVISLFAKGADKRDIAAGIHVAIAKRVGGMAKRLGVVPRVVFCGGVAKNLGVKKALERELGVEISSPENPQITGALGAALIALESSKSSN
ncbi:MAG: acyl-CoA dehydratase activase [Promethearchaeota archaeon]